MNQDFPADVHHPQAHRLAPQVRLIDLGRQISDALSAATGEILPQVFTTSDKLTVHMTERQHEHLLSKLTEATAA